MAVWRFTGCSGLTCRIPGPIAPTETVVVTATEPVEVEPVEVEPVETGAEPVEAAANADVTFVRAVQTGDDTWTFHVTVAHPDTGWEDYADGWDVVLPDGTVVKPDADSPFTRLLLHPHETEQPFTRSQSNIVIPTTNVDCEIACHIDRQLIVVFLNGPDLNFKINYIKIIKSET